MGYRSRLAVLFVVGLLALVAAGCGGGGSSSTSSDTGSTETTSTKTTGNKATGEPILIGFHSESALPNVIAAFKAGIANVNENGGVNGRPIEASYCKTEGTPEQSIDCANRFVEEGVVAAVQGFDSGADASIAILKEAGIPEIGQYALGPQTTEDIGHSFFFEAPLQAIGISALLAVNEPGIHVVRYFAPDAPNTHSLLDEVVKPAAKELGLDADFIFYNATSPDWTSLVATAKSQGAEAIGAMGASEDECTAMLTAVGQIGFDGPVYAAYCTQFATTLEPSVIAGTRTGSAVYPPELESQAPAEVAEHLQVYKQAVEEAGESFGEDVVSQGAYGLALNLADALDQVKGDVTAQSVLKTMPTVKGNRYFGGDYNCDGSAWPGTTACSAQVLLLEVQEDGSRKIFGNGFLDLSKYVPKSE